MPTEEEATRRHEESQDPCGRRGLALSKAAPDRKLPASIELFRRAAESDSGYDSGQREGRVDGGPGASADGRARRVATTEDPLLTPTPPKMDSLTEYGLEFQTDKAFWHLYTPKYHEYFSKVRRGKNNILEIGIGSTHAPSLKMLASYFESSLIYAIDVKEDYVRAANAIDRVRAAVCDSSDAPGLISELGAVNWDVIIDDGSHLGSHQKTAFETLFPLVSPGGIYICEDLHTSGRLLHENPMVPYFLKHPYGSQYQSMEVFQRDANALRCYRCRRANPGGDRCACGVDLSPRPGGNGSGSGSITLIIVKGRDITQTQWRGTVALDGVAARSANLQIDPPAAEKGRVDGTPGAAGGGGVRAAFFVRHFTLRGTEVATYNYAELNEERGGTSVIIALSQEQRESLGWPSTDASLERFRSRFEVALVSDIAEVRSVMDKRQLDVFFTRTSGARESTYRFDDPAIWAGIRTVVQCVFDTRASLGEVSRVCIGDDLNRRFGTSLPVLPGHCVSLPLAQPRRLFPDSFTVYGRHGGRESFDVPFVWKAIRRALDARDDIAFVFLGTDPVVEHERVTYQPPTDSRTEVSAFIRGCDAMLHARSRGETFGAAVAEFSSLGKPVVTWSDSPEREHIRTLGDRAILYANEEELVQILTGRKCLQSRPRGGTRIRHTPAVGWLSALDGLSHIRDGW